MTAPQVLFVNSNRIGDCVISSGLIREIGRQLPGAEITVACGVAATPLFRSAPGVTRVIALKKKKLAGHWLGLWAEARRTRWDLVIDVRGSALAWLLPAKRRAVYNRRLETGARKVEVASRLIGADEALAPELFIDTRARVEAAAIIDPQMARGSGPGPILALAPVASHARKSWPADRWAQLIERLKAEPGFDGWRFMLCGGPDDHEAAAPALAAAGDRGLDFVRGDILCAAAGFQRAALFAGNDSGLMHVSAAAGTPTLGLFGPTEWWLYKAWGSMGRTVAANPRQGEFAPIEALTVDQVFEALVTLRREFAARAEP